MARDDAHYFIAPYDDEVPNILLQESRCDFCQRRVFSDRLSLDKTICDRMVSQCKQGRASTLGMVDQGLEITERCWYAATEL